MSALESVLVSEWVSVSESALESALVLASEWALASALAWVLASVSALECWRRRGCWCRVGVGVGKGAGGGEAYRDTARRAGELARVGAGDDPGRRQVPDRWTDSWMT